LGCIIPALIGLLDLVIAVTVWLHWQNRTHRSIPARRLGIRPAATRFVALQVEVKTAYQLWVSANERRAMATVLDRC
jgi:hypothetical protein